MDPSSLKTFRHALLGLRETLVDVGDVALDPVRTDAVTTADEDEQPLAEMSQTIASRRNADRLERLKDIANALRKLDSSPKDFGCCERCEEDIAGRRLRALPFARLCIRCKSLLEAEGLSTSRRHLTDYR